MQQRRSSTIVVPVRRDCPRGDSDFRENVKANGRQSKETFSTPTSRHEETIASHFAHLIFELTVQIPDVGRPTTRSVDSFCTTTQGRRSAIMIFSSYCPGSITNKLLTDLDAKTFSSDQFAICYHLSQLYIVRPATVSSLVHSLLLMPRAFGKFVAGSTEREEV
ncbi:unnamed protein product [Sphagnum jensenii]|uniref:Uncharacterized protein n=1 Tax=Sphagnum jensenii TaxID=128206 RepID=A0ABP1C0G7_9BRYO